MGWKVFHIHYECIHIIQENLFNQVFPCLKKIECICLTRFQLSVCLSFWASLEHPESFDRSQIPCLFLNMFHSNAQNMLRPCHHIYKCCVKPPVLCGPHPVYILLPVLVVKVHFTHRRPILRHERQSFSKSLVLKETRKKLKNMPLADIMPGENYWLILSNH